MEFKHVPGMDDVLPADVGRWQALEREFRTTVESYGYAEVRTPVIESTHLFVRSMGETTDVVEKEMYSFSRSDEELTVRPEGTAGAVRAYVEHHVAAREPVSRWYYLGPMFRAERPQRGRLRQFHQAGCELFGDAGPTADAEMIDMLVGMLGRLGVAGVTVHLNSLGSGDTRARYRDALTAYLTPLADRLSETSRRRLAHNPLRVLDSKEEADRALVHGAPKLHDLFDDADRAHWTGLCAALDALGTPYVVDPTLVRGLDYYTRTLFEIRSTAGDLGAQNTLLGGGRYDGMVRSLGGPDAPGIGFAMGLERILLATPDSAPPRAPFAFVATLGERARHAGLVLSRSLRAAGARVELDARGTSLKSQLRRADSLGAALCLVLGDGEVDRRVVQVKDLAAHSQEELTLDAAPLAIAERLAARGTPQ